MKALLSIFSIIGFIIALSYWAVSTTILPEYKTFAKHLEVYTTPLNKTYSDDLPFIPSEPITVIFAGDTRLDGSIHQTISQEGTNYPFTFVSDEVRQADEAILNLETAVTTFNERDPVQLYNFKANPNSLDSIKQAGFDTVSLANNHTLDYKGEGFLDTIRYLQEYELSYFGAGRDKEEAYSPHTLQIKDKVIKVLGFSKFLPAVRWYEGKGPVIASGYQMERVLNTIEREAKNTDYLIIYIHWGVEGNTHPETWQRDYARKMIDHGADGVVGAHPHVLQGFEYYKEKPIAYSLGNFLFPDYVQGKTAETGLLTLTLDETILKMAFTPYEIRADQIVPLKVEEEQHMYQYLEQISFNVTIENAEIRAQK